MRGNAEVDRREHLGRSGEWRALQSTSTRPAVQELQRCVLHKRRNVADHLPAEAAGWVDTKLARAFNHADPDAGLRAAKDLARSLEDRWPDAAASLREGLDEMFTVPRLGAPTAWLER